MGEKEAVRTERAPAPFQGAPYSQAIRANGLVFVSGQLALRPDHAEIVSEDIGEQTGILEQRETLVDHIRIAAEIDDVLLDVGLECVEGNLDAAAMVAFARR